MKKAQAAIGFSAEELVKFLLAAAIIIIFLAIVYFKLIQGINII